jgi:phosphate uptake regulator
MEKRKLIKFGNTSLVLTLPNDWIQNNKLNKGDSVSITSCNQVLIIKPSIETNEKRAIIDLDNKPLKLFNKELISYYLKNYKFIEIKGKNILEKLDQVKVFQEKLSSVEIIEMGEEKIVLKDLTSPENLNLDNLINEIIDMEVLLFNNLIEVCSNGESKKNKSIFITTLDKNINKLTFLAYKSLNYNLDNIIDGNRIKNSVHLWKLISSFEQIGDIIKRLARYLNSIDDENFNGYNLTEILKDLSEYFKFSSSLVNKDVNLDQNLRLYLDKKQTILKELENLRDEFRTNLNLFLVISQLIKDIIGQLDTIILAIIDIRK